MFWEALKFRNIKEKLFPTTNPQPEIKTPPPVMVAQPKLQEDRTTLAASVPQFTGGLFSSAILQDIGGFRGPWRSKTPKGVVVHYTAGPSLKAAISELKLRSLAYHFIITRDGVIYQTANCNQKTAHAGISEWRGLYCNSEFIGLAIDSWGLLKIKDGKRYAWPKNYGLEIQSEVNVTNVNGRDEYWEAATDPQEKSFWTLLRAILKEYNISPDFVCGHDECAVPKGRKCDPGGTLPTMASIREALKNGTTV